MANKVETAGKFRKPRGDYKFLTEISGRHTPKEDDSVVIAALFTETSQFMVTGLEAAKRNFGMEIAVDGNSVIARVAKAHDLENRVRYLYTLLDDFGFRIYALFVVGVVTDDAFQAFDIYAGTPGQGQFLPEEQVKMFLEQTNIAGLEV